MTTSPLPLDDDTAGAVVDAMMPLVGIPMAPEWRETVIASVKATAAAARLVLEFPLDDTVEPAPVFRASEPSASEPSASGASA